MRLLSTTIVAAAVVLAGCATSPAPLGPNEARITFESNPPGATISGDGQTYRTPVELTFTLPRGHQNYPTNPITARWVSGASVTTTVSLRRGILHYVFQRPEGVAGLEQDVGYAIHRERMSAPTDSGVGDALSDMGRTLGAAAVRQRAAPPPAPTAPQTINCSSYARPSGIETRCR